MQAGLTDSKPGWTNVGWTTAGLTNMQHLRLVDIVSQVYAKQSLEMKGKL